MLDIFDLTRLIRTLWDIVVKEANRLEEVEERTPCFLHGLHHKTHLYRIEVRVYRGSM